MTGRDSSPWYRLPRLVRYGLVAVVAAVVLWLLFTQIFPWVETFFEDPRLGRG